jgi:hypothetical protein
MPARPANVSGLAPTLVPSRAISARPRVISDALELSPNPIPSAIPAEMAMTFFIAPHSSHPTTSGFVYTRKNGAMNRDWRLSAVASSTHATTEADGIRRTTSRARLGPDTTAIRLGSRSASSAITSVIRRRVSCSMPFVSETSGVRSSSSGTTRRNTSRNAWEGTARTTTEARWRAFSRSPVARSDGGSSNPGR